MKTIITISWRNIWRNRTRTLVIITALVLGLMGGVFSAAIRLAAEEQQFEETIENQISHIQFHHSEFLANPEAFYRLPDGQAMAQQVQARNDVLAVSPRTALDGMIASANMTAGTTIKGIDPATEARTTNLDKLLEEGSYFEDEGRIPSMIIGRALAKNFNARPGSRLVLTFQDIHGEVISSSFRVEGIFSVTSRRFEERNVFVRADVLNQLIGDEEAVTEIAVVLKQPDNFRLVTDEFRNTWPGLEIRHWADMDPPLFYALEVLDQVLIWLVAIIIFGVSFGLLNTILMSILERVKELGVLMAIGMKRIKVFAMIMIETTMIAIIGGIIGLSLSFAMIRILNQTGVRIPGGDGLQDFGFASVLYPDIGNAFYFQIGIVVIIFAILASIYPAWKATHFVPAEAVRAE